MDELTMEDLEGRRIWDRFGRRAARSWGGNSWEHMRRKKKKGGLTRKRPLRVSLRCRSTALWVALRSAVLARLLGLRLVVVVEVGVVLVGEVGVLLIGSWGGGGGGGEADSGSEGGESAMGSRAGLKRVCVCVCIRERWGGRQGSRELRWVSTDQVGPERRTAGGILVTAGLAEREGQGFGQTLDYQTTMHPRQYTIPYPPCPYIPIPSQTHSNIRCHTLRGTC